MTTFLTAALFTVAAIAFAVGANALWQVFVAVDIALSDLFERVMDLEDEVVELTEAANTRIEDEGEGWKHGYLDDDE